jgi:predicted aldo/keto reductase-like oxidoreductase
MIYKDFQGLKLSALGMGTMRFPTVNGNRSEIDQTAVEEMVAYAMKKGVNYYDTAWGYHDGQAELAIGKALKKYPRESFYLADKFPGYDVKNIERVEEIFEKQLEKCQVEYFDFYLVHCVTDGNVDNYVDPKYRVREYLFEQKRNGRIRHLGFSLHGSVQTMEKIMDYYGEMIEFCQIQLNWLDWDLQDAKSAVERLREYGLPIWVMEPVRGGSLAKVDPFYESKLKEMRPNASTVEWAFRFLQSFPDVVVTLSGMSDMSQLQQNIATFESEQPTTEQENTTLFAVAKSMTEKQTLPCTSCRYCTTYCPMELNIPTLIELYNEHIYSGGVATGLNAIDELPDDKKPSACVGCRACEAVCPQAIKISEMMPKFMERLTK